jgi:hypothetical protein
MKLIMRPCTSIALTILIFTALPVYASVNLELSGGVTIQSTGNVWVQIDGNVTTTGGSYFAGEISSGSRLGITDFSGMHLNPGIDGTIVCTTGSAYGKSHGEGANFKRWYTVTNTGGGPVTTKMKIDYTGSGADDERNSLSAPFFIYRYASSWAGYGFGVSASPDTSDGVQIPTGSSDWVLSEGSRTAVKVYLQGPYSTGTHDMGTALSASIPLTSPYSEDARKVSAVPSGVTDWVLLQVRSTATGSVLASRSCFLKTNGKLVADDGTTEYAGIHINPGDYYLILKHRNHLKVMSAAAVTGLTWGTTPSSTCDFSTGTDKYYGADAKLLETGVYGMYAGDANGSGTVDASDRSATWNGRNQCGCLDADCNLSGTVDASDRSITWNNRNKSTSVP